MAYIYNKDEEDKVAQQEAATAQPGQNPLQSSAPSGGAAGGTEAQLAGASEAPKPAGSGFINLSRYLDANKPAIATMAKARIGGLEAQGTAAQKQVAGAQESTLADINKNTFKDTSDVNSIAATQQAANQGQYQGPTGLKLASGLEEQVMDTSSKFNALGSEGGLQSTFGLGGFDSQLLQAGAGSQFADSKQKFRGLNNLLVDAHTRVGAAANHAMESSNQALGGAKARALKHQEIMAQARGEKDVMNRDYVQAMNDRFTKSMGAGYNSWQEYEKRQGRKVDPLLEAMQAESDPGVNLAAILKARYGLTGAGGHEASLKDLQEYEKRSKGVDLNFASDEAGHFGEAPASARLTPEESRARATRFQQLQKLLEQKKAKQG